MHFGWSWHRGRIRHLLNGHIQLVVGGFKGFKDLNLNKPNTSVRNQLLFFIRTDARPINSHQLWKVKLGKFSTRFNCYIFIMPLSILLIICLKEKH